MTGPFQPSSRVYDLVYSHLDYPATARAVEQLVRERIPDARSLLDMACGTGLHLAVWRDTFDDVEGADIDETLLEVARDRLGDIVLHVADYTDFDLGRRYDVVTCMFSAIGYAHTPDRLDSAIAAMSRHLEQGGVLVVEPWLTPSRVGPRVVRAHVAEENETVVMRSSRHTFCGDDSGGVSELEFAYVVTTTDGTEFFTEEHVMGVFPPQRYREAFTRAGLSAEFLEELPDFGRGLVVGTKS